MTQPLQHPTISARDLGWLTRQEVVDNLRAQVATQAARIAELEAQLLQAAGQNKVDGPDQGDYVTIRSGGP